jgi:hypothetical protein
MNIEQAVEKVHDERMEWKKSLLRTSSAMESGCRTFSTTEAS